MPITRLTLTISSLHPPPTTDRHRPTPTTRRRQLSHHLYLAFAFHVVARLLGPSPSLSSIIYYFHRSHAPAVCPRRPQLSRSIQKRPCSLKVCSSRKCRPSSIPAPNAKVSDIIRTKGAKSSSTSLAALRLARGPHSTARSSTAQHADVEAEKHVKCEQHSHVSLSLSSCVSRHRHTTHAEPQVTKSARSVSDARSRHFRARGL